MNSPDYLGLVYFGSKYILMAFAVWLTIHTWITTPRQTDVLYYDFRPWLHRHPMAMIALALGIDCFMLFALNNMKPQYQQAYVDLLVAGAPIFYTWTALIGIVATAAGAFYTYRIRNTRLGAALSGAAIALMALVAPYYFPF